VNAFTDKEMAYLREQRIGRLATVDSKGRPHVVPTGFNLDGDKGVLEIGAHDLPDRGQKRLYVSHIRANPYVAFVVDDLVTEPTWAPRGVSVRGPAQIHPEGSERLAPGFGPIWVEIVPESISAWGIDTSAYEPPNSRKVVTA
jgi:pyridoxamine 5'-phosphate oxidase family protein